MSGTALITGGAGGIAAELASRLQARGYRLVLIDHDAERLGLRGRVLGGEVRTVAADLTSEPDLERLCALIDGIEDLSLFINNAGIIEPGDVLKVDYAVQERHVRINLLAAMRLTQAAVGNMVARGAGTVLSIVSAAGVVALPGSAAYTASKFGLRGYLTALSQEVAQHGVRIRNVFPGAVDTPMLRYEATHGGSPLNFLNKDVLTAHQVADACIKAMDGKALETFLPFSDGFTARLVGTLPGLIPMLLPSLQKKGERGMQRYLQSRGLKPRG